ncbi:hypothetical protein [Effusibacillus lacus]|uniref:hypothetical protein n=1 Tax=Effusibacillus lacus TaxID=1348429 RepID=UPI0010DF580F|nr:hypothetical protein [Effusibacillus lacus]TCS71080.1 hypothetical protein EDD64_12825 [Effusibacillus lacus]
MRYIFVFLWAVGCVLAGEGILRKGIVFQLQGIRRGIWLQVLAAFISLGLPILAALLIE